VILLFGVILILLQPSLRAQEQGPLAMQIMFNWTAAGAVGGGFIGFALWLTDPGNPNTQLSDQMARGAALGAILGAGYGLFIMQRSLVVPIRGQVYIRDPLDPKERITSDPVAAASGFDRPSLSTVFSRSGGGSGLQLPLFGFKF
jgi:hypothetical protein